MLEKTPTLFGEIRQPSTPYLFIPKVSSERRNYLPIGFVSPDIIASSSALIVPEASLYHFGILSSAMHNAWMKVVCGRMKSDYQYSAQIVYNNFPWPQEITDDRRAAIEGAAQAVLDARAPHLGESAAVGCVAVNPVNPVILSKKAVGCSDTQNAPVGRATLADLYDPLAMPQSLVKAHAALDTAVERAYRTTKFSTDTERVTFLFELHSKLDTPLLPTETAKKRRK